MYNEKIRESIYKYHNKRKDDPILKEQKMRWSRECFNRMKEENGERYLKKKQGGRIRYWIKLLKNTEDQELIFKRLKNKDIELYEKVILLV